MATKVIWELEEGALKDLFGDAGEEESVISKEAKEMEKMEDVSLIEDEDLKELQKDAEKAAKITEDAIKDIEANATKDVKAQASEIVEEPEVKKSVELTEEQKALAEKVEKKPNFLKRLWAWVAGNVEKFGGWIASNGMVFVKAYGEYLKFQFISDIVDKAQKDIQDTIHILGKPETRSSLPADQSSTLDMVKKAYGFIESLNRVISRMDKALKMVTSSSDKPRSVRNMMANTFVEAESRELVGKASELLAAATSVLTNNAKALLALNDAGFSTTMSGSDVAAALPKAVAALNNIKMADLDNFVTKANNYGAEVHKLMAKHSDTSSLPMDKMLKRALTLPKNYKESLSGLESIVKAATKSS